ncbi:MAG: hypothetical protein J6R00_00980, partial [Lentisphaeria bacterium]|nr:hypothetical protein [Lentisphaeria bacterium]
GHIPKKCPSLRLVMLAKKHKSKCAVQISHGHTDSKCFFAIRLCFEVPVQRWTFTISLSFLFIMLCIYGCFYLADKISFHVKSDATKNTTVLGQMQIDLAEISVDLLPPPPNGL